MDRFLKETISENITFDQAYEEIITKLMVKNLQGSEKFSQDLDAYDSETLFAGQIVPGNIYIFTYNQQKPVTYKTADKTFSFIDTLPVVMVTGFANNIFRGINFNYCPKDIRLQILNTFINTDEPYFYNKIESFIRNDVRPHSDSYNSFIMSGERNILTHINKATQKKCDTLFHNYSANKVISIRMIEPWQWKFIPYLYYKDTIKQEILTRIYQINGFNK